MVAFLLAYDAISTDTYAPITGRLPDVLIVDKGFGMRMVLDWIHDLEMAEAAPAVTVWGVSMAEAEAPRLLQAGAKGIVRKTADLESILSCLRTVVSGKSWMEDCVFRDSGRGRGAIPARSSPRASTGCSKWWSRDLRIKKSRSNWVSGRGR
jgi:DNA-binding NarL/FixJ family response regulator